MKILFINLGWEQVPLIDRVAELDVELYGIHYDSNYYKGPRYRDVLISDLRDLSRILRFAEKIRPDMVVSDQCDYSMFAQALITEKLGLPGPGIQAAQIANSKILQRKYAKQNFITSPDYQVCYSLDDALTAAEKFGYPVMIKPPDNRGSFGVNRADTPADVKNHYYDAVMESHSRAVLVEQYIKGQHITVDGYVFHGHGPKALAIATKRKLEEKNSIIDGEITYPGQLENSIYERAKRNLEAIANKFGYKFGFLHGEFIVTESGDIYLTEIANRGGGVFTSEIIVPNVSGIDILAVYLNDCAGKTIIDVNYDIGEIQTNPTLLKFFSFSHARNGVVKSINGLDKLKSNSHILKVKMLLHPGDVISGISSGADRHGMIIVTGSTLEDAKAQLADAIDVLEVKIEEN